MFLRKIDEKLALAITDAGYETATEIQKKSISKIKSGENVIAISPEKSGKTTSLVIALIQQLKYAVDDVPRALIVVPDQEHADALKEQFDILGRNTDLRVFCVYNRLKLLKLKDDIYMGSDVVIGTADILNELYSISGLNLTGLKYFAVDDAELTIKSEAIPQIDRLSDIIPKSQFIVYAQKMTDRIERLAERYMNYPTIIEL